MMRKLKKMIALVLCASMMFLMSGITTFAANGELRFSDPTTSVGAMVDVSAKLSANYSLADVQATLAYDSTSLKYIGGEGTSESNGKIELTGNGSGDTSVSWTIQFQALSEGTTKITIDSVSATDTDGDDVSVTEGNSTITIEPGDPSLIEEESDTKGGSGTVTIGGKTYSVETEIPEILIPNGFVNADLEYDGQVLRATKQENGEMYAVYLKNEEEECDFYLYDPESKAFTDFEQIMISEERGIVLLSEDMSELLPDNFQKTTMTVSGKEFPAWQNIDASSYYVVYALNSDGEKGFYQYDTVDDTYQRYVPEAKDTEDENKPAGGLLEKLKNNLDKVIMVIWGIFLVMLLIIIVIGIKLRHRNMELDDLYDEYGIDDEEPVKESHSNKKADKKKAKADKKAEKAAKKEAKKAAKRKKSEDDFDDFDYDDEEDQFEEFKEVPMEMKEDIQEDEFEEEEFEEEELDDLFDEFGVPNFEDEGEIEDLDEIIGARVKKKVEKKTAMQQVGPSQPTLLGHSDIDDTFKLDLIDLD